MPVDTGHTAGVSILPYGIWDGLRRFCGPSGDPEIRVDVLRQEVVFVPMRVAVDHRGVPGLPHRLAEGAAHRRADGRAELRLRVLLDVVDHGPCDLVPVRLNRRKHHHGFLLRGSYASGVAVQVHAHGDAVLMCSVDVDGEFRVQRKAALRLACARPDECEFHASARDGLPVDFVVPFGDIDAVKRRHLRSPRYVPSSAR